MVVSAAGIVEIKGRKKGCGPVVNSCDSVMTIKQDE
jgi:hypothetical protein